MSTMDEIAEAAIKFTYGIIATGAAMYGASVWYEHHVPENNNVRIEFSHGREQLLDKGLAGTKSDLKSYLRQQTEEYFRQRNLACDPGEPSANPKETLNRAKCLPLGDGAPRSKPTM